jgi:hypothetical protein
MSEKQRTLKEAIKLTWYWFTYWGKGEQFRNLSCTRKSWI